MSFRTNLLGTRVKLVEATPWLHAGECGTIRVIQLDSDGLWCVVQMDCDQRFWSFELCNLIATQ